MTFKFLQNDRVLTSKFKVFTISDNLNVAQTMEYVWDRVKNKVWKEEYATSSYQSPFLLCFQKTFFFQGC